MLSQACELPNSLLASPVEAQNANKRLLELLVDERVAERVDRTVEVAEPVRDIVQQGRYAGLALFDAGAAEPNQQRQYVPRRHHAQTPLASISCGLVVQQTSCCDKSTTNRKSTANPRDKLYGTRPHQVEGRQHIHSIATCQDTVQLPVGLVVRQIHNKSKWSGVRASSTARRIQRSWTVRATASSTVRTLRG